MRTLIFIILAVSVFALSACGAGIEQAVNTITDGVEDTTTEGILVPGDLPALDPEQVPGTRATITWEDLGDSYAIDDDGDGEYEEITPDCDGSDCTFTEPGLDPNGLYPVSVIYPDSQPGIVVINTTLKGAMYNGYVMASGYGSGLAVGDVNGDGHADILVGPRANAAAANRRVDLFLGGPDLIDASGNMQPWANFTDLDSITHGSVVHIADVTCDGNGDLLIAEYNNAGGEGIVHVIDSDDIVAGNQSTDGVHAYKIRDDDMDTNFGLAFAPIDADGSGCHSLAIGAPQADNGALFDVGELYVVSPSDIIGELAVPDSMRVFQGASTGDMAGLYVANAGDVDGSGLEKALFNRERDAGLPVDIDLVFSNLAYFGMFTSIDNGGGPVIAMGKLGGDDFYLRGGMAAGAFVNLYDDGSSFIPESQVISDTRDSFGSGVALANLYQGSSALDLLVGSDTDILVYFDYGLGAGFDVMPDAILSNVEGLTTMTGRNMIVADVTGDGYDDIIAADPSYDDGAITDVGAIYVYY